MKTYKLTPLEELRLEKKKLREERAIASQRLAYQLQYLNDNWGTMLTKGVTSSVKSKLTETLENFRAVIHIMLHLLSQNGQTPPGLAL